MILLPFAQESLGRVENGPGEGGIRPLQGSKMTLGRVVFQPLGDGRRTSKARIPHLSGSNSSPRRVELLPLRAGFDPS